MKPPTMQQFMARFREVHPDYPIIAPEYESPDGPGITHFVHILNVPNEHLVSVVDQAWDILLEMYGDAQFPFLLTAISPKSSREHFAARLNDHG